MQTLPYPDFPRKKDMPHQAETSMQTLEAHVHRILYHNPEQDFYILLCEDDNNNEIKILGSFHNNPKGQKIVAYGNFEYNKRRDEQQFKAVFIEPGGLDTTDALKVYLATLGIPGIRNRIASNIVDHFGLETLDIMDENPDLLFEAKRVPMKAVEYLHEHWHGFRKNREFVLFLINIGISPTKIEEIRKTLGFNAESIIRKDPYILCRKISRFGFEKADAVALRLGITKDSPVRKRAFLEHVLRQGLRNGACGQPRQKVISEAVNFLRMSREHISDFTDNLVGTRKLMLETIDHEDILYLPKIHDTECGIASMLLEMNGKKPCWYNHLDIEEEIEYQEDSKNQGELRLGAEQIEAVRMILGERLSVMTGGPGVGKTTTLKTILDILLRNKTRIALCAPTGMAAKRMSEATGQQATTIHRLLEIDPEDGCFKHNAENTLDVDLVIADEFSMTDISLAFSLIEAIGPQTSLLIVGDVDQLPSVGPGRVLHDIISSGMVPVSRMTQIYRQDDSSRIIPAAHAINRGETPPSPPENTPSTDLDFLFVELKNPTPSNVQDAIIRMVCDRLPNHPMIKDGYDPIRDVMIVAAIKNREAGTRALNLKLRERLNPLPPKGHSDRFDVTSDQGEFTLSFGIGDKVMNTVNKYDKGIVNGDIGYVSAISNDRKEIVVDFESEKNSLSVSLSKKDAQDLLLAYAITVHKSQGSESKILLMPVIHDYRRMLQRNLVYTGLTRAKTLGIMVGSGSALEKAIKTVDSTNRWSFTGEAMRRSGNALVTEPDYGF